MGKNKVCFCKVTLGAWPLWVTLMDACKKLIGIRQMGQHAP
jgi:hypothetical protein